jgi:hypothetical protein
MKTLAVILIVVFGLLSGYLRYLEYKDLDN